MPIGMALMALDLEITWSSTVATCIASHASIPMASILPNPWQQLTSLAPLDYLPSLAS
jgi:hypothetical protein